MTGFAASAQARHLAIALLDQLQGAARERALGALGGREDLAGVDAEELAAAMRAADVDAAAAHRIGLAASVAVDVALAVRLAGVASTERALRQCDRLLPREHPDGVYLVESLEAGEASIRYCAAGRTVDPLLCSVRAGLLSGLPRCFGAALARVEETACAAHGAEACTYRVRWRRGLGDRPLLQVLAIAALLGAMVGTVGWALSLWSPAASVTFFAALGVAAAGWLVDARRAAPSDHREAVAVELERRIGERMDELAKLDASVERRDAAVASPRSSFPPSAEHAAAMRREVAAFGRALSALRSEAESGGEGASSIALQIAAFDVRFEQLRGVAEALVGEVGSTGPRREREDLRSLLEYVVGRVRGAGGAGPEIVLEVPADLPFVVCDPSQIEQALVLLIQHASVAAGAGGRVDVVAAAVDSGVELTVRDDGPALDPELVDEAFDPFFGDERAATEQVEALRATARIVAEHGGALQLRAESERGNRASFVLAASRRS